MAEPNLESSGLDQNSTTNTNTEYNRSTTSDSTVLPYYELRLPSHVFNKSPSKIEFQLVQKPPYKPRRPTVPRRNAHCNGCHSKSTQEPEKPKFRKNLKRVFFNFNRKTCPVEPPSHDQAEDHSEEQHFENMEVYYFDHGCPEFYRTTDCPPHLVTEALAQSTHHHATKFWAEIFGTINIGTTFVISFWLQLYRFLLYGVLRAILVGFLQISADYLLKPLLAVIFNGLIQPPLVFVQNVLTAVGEMLLPIARLVGSFTMPVERIFRSLRIVENKTINKKIIKKRRFDV